MVGVKRGSGHKTYGTVIENIHFFQERKLLDRSAHTTHALAMKGLGSPGQVTLKAEMLGALTYVLLDTS